MDRSRDPDSHVMVIIMLTGDLLGMSLTTDNVRPSPTPNAWRIGATDDRGRFSWESASWSSAPPSWRARLPPGFLESKR